MDDRLASWLRLREPLDAAARSAAVTRELVDAVGSREPIRVLDLGTGTGANVRYLAPHLPPRQQWLIVDRDSANLALVPARMSAWAGRHGFGVEERPDGCAIVGQQLTCEVETRIVDLARLDDARLFAGRHVVTASALLDLASEQWLATLAGHCRRRGAAVLFALSYNGWSTCSPTEREDDMMRDLLNRHQRTDKGLGGVAAGPEAAACAIRCLADAGYHVRSERSDWMLDASANELQRRLVDGWRDVAVALMPTAADTIDRWHRRRHGHIDASQSRIVVGHVDISGRPRE